jgi:riboflavin kinase/FMN adenylyltransferase
LDDQYKLIPAMGVYASLVEYKGEIYKGMTYIGLRTTINALQLTVETNILSFVEDLYYVSLTIKLLERIRDERKFGNLNSLKEQLKTDRETTIKLLKGY